jgi:hypothetical protein
VLHNGFSARPQGHERYAEVFSVAVRLMHGERIEFVDERGIDGGRR